LPKNEGQVADWNEKIEQGVVWFRTPSDISDTS